MPLLTLITPNKNHLAGLKLAAESLSQASDAHFELWERIRALVFPLRDERDALRGLVDDERTGTSG